MTSSKLTKHEEYKIALLTFIYLCYSTILFSISHQSCTISYKEHEANEAMIIKSFTCQVLVCAVKHAYNMSHSLAKHLTQKQVHKRTKI